MSELQRLHKAAMDADMSTLEGRNTAWKALIHHLPTAVVDGGLAVTYIARDLRKHYEDHLNGTLIERTSDAEVEAAIEFLERNIGFDYGFSMDDARIALTTLRAALSSRDARIADGQMCERILAQRVESERMRVAELEAALDKACDAWAYHDNCTLLEPNMHTDSGWYVDRPAAEFKRFFMAGFRATGDGKRHSTYPTATDSKAKEVQP